ncbi:MAG: P-loop NTPase fold protein, partial [Planctomycetota bacterium]
MKPKLAAILKHIVDSLFVVVLATTIVFVTWIVAQSYCEKFIIWATQFEFLFLEFGIIAISVVLGWIFPKEVKASFKSLKLWPRHWGLVVRGFLGSILTLGLVWWTGLFEIENKWLITFVLGIIVIEGLVLFIGSGVAQVHLILSESSRSSVRDKHTDDQPIHTLEENEFPEYEVTSRRILERLNIGNDSGGRGPNVAVIGPYGSGKTSLCNLIEDISRKEEDGRISVPLVFCRFEAWEFLTADAAVRGLLDQIVSKVEELVDCSGLGSLPEEYLDALRACPNGWLGMIAAMLRKKRNSEEVIRKVQDVLIRLGKRVVVFVDDFDRLENKSKETQQAIAAALNQLQNLT